MKDFVCKSIDERMEKLEGDKPHKPWYQTEDARAAIKKLAAEDETKE